jgi:hypothetical protein
MYLYITYLPIYPTPAPPAGYAGHPHPPLVYPIHPILGRLHLSTTHSSISSPSLLPPSPSRSPLDPLLTHLPLSWDARIQTAHPLYSTPLPFTHLGTPLTTILRGYSQDGQPAHLTHLGTLDPGYRTMPRGSQFLYSGCPGDSPRLPGGYRTILVLWQDRNFLRKFREIPARVYRLRRDKHA